ncbi:hypothetical protein OHA79_09535 [Streptomyces sp. NBC_00841]|uniref:hypothetical protein n=1 Tax=Streptomyces sp. NBC_00841 TaxID=2975847 RepID=UPI002DDC61DE|nr:hypothetical protein [Streptomyces sp. NBC_00841]WRZ98056.1 hypothetical protein OHA79_09535 [Streptomyces sp. NBC_00841]
MAPKSIDELNQELRDEVAAATERVRTLAEEGKAEASAELAKETTTLIDKLPSKERAGLKAKVRAAGKAKAKAVEPSAVAKADEVVDLAQFEGVPELITMGGQKIKAIMDMTVKSEDGAREIAAIIFDMRLRIPHNGLPDLKAASHAAKQASAKMYASVGVIDADEFEHEQAQNKLRRAVQYRMRDVSAEYLRSLDKDKDQAQRFAPVMEGWPKGAKVSVIVSTYYGLSLKGPTEIERERYAARKALEAAGKTPEVEAAPEPKPEEVVQHVLTGIHKALRGAKASYFEGLPADRKAEVRDELEDLNKVIKAMLAAVL